MPLPDDQRMALFLEMHRSIEDVATKTAAQLVGAGAVELMYPPNSGFTAAEAAALQHLRGVPNLESALRKVIASAANGPLFDLMVAFDGVGGLAFYHGNWLGVRVEPVPEEDDDEPDDAFFHDDIYEAYWEWRRRRPDPGWRLDTLDYDVP